MGVAAAVVVLAIAGGWVWYRMPGAALPPTASPPIEPASAPLPEPAAPASEALPPAESAAPAAAVVEPPSAAPLPPASEAATEQVPQPSKAATNSEPPKRPSEVEAPAKAPRQPAIRVRKPTPPPAPPPVEPPVIAPVPPPITAPTPATPPVRPAQPDWYTSLKAELNRCSGQNFINRVICEEKAKWQFCYPGNHWGEVPECVKSQRPENQ